MTRGDEYGADAQGGEFAQVRQQVAEARLPVFPQVEVAGQPGNEFTISRLNESWVVR